MELQVLYLSAILVIRSISTYQYLLQTLHIPRHDAKAVAQWSHHQVSRINTSCKRIGISPFYSFGLERGEYSS